METKKLKRVGVMVLALALTVTSLYKISDVQKSAASIVKNNGQAAAGNGLAPVTYNGQNMYVAEASYYDYYSDTQVGTSATPGEITDAVNWKLNTFSKFNKRLMEVMKYNVAAECPAKYPMYQGRQCLGLTDHGAIYSPTDDSVNVNSNYWVGANHGQLTGGGFASQGLVDSKLKYENGVGYLMQSNPANGKSAKVPFFDKKVLTENKHTGSQLPLANVREKVSFPFRTEVADGVTYYEYDSAVDTVLFNSSNQLTYYGKNSSEMVKDAYGTGGLFPDNKAADSGSGKLNFGYGFRIDVPFNMTSDGKIGGKDMVFEFSGDDDVWVFVDGILALDMGGAHPKITGSINFATGKTVIQGVRNPKVSFSSRGIRGYKATDTINGEPASFTNYTQDLTEELKNKLRNTGEVHTLTLFYMERGMDVSNMKMKFNLPEPTKLDVANTVKVDNVGDTFKEETEKVAKKDSFVYDVVDKTKNTKAQIDMFGGESVSFLNEFNAKDIILVQETGLKSNTRKLTDLYSTSWLVKDMEAELGKGNGLVVQDSRRTDKTILFTNKNNDKTPVLRAEYVNVPLIGKFVLKCTVTEKYKDKHTDYKDKEFKYTITYADVFGGGSEEKPYKGKYIIKTEAGETKEKTTEDGTVKLKPGETVTIERIPVLTEVKAKVELTDEIIISKVKFTSQFSYDKENYVAKGKLNNIANVVEYIIGDKSETAQKEEDLTKDEIENITGEEVPQYKEPEKLETVTLDEDALDDTAKTADETDLATWVMLLAISLMLAVGSGISMAGLKKKQ